MNKLGRCQVREIDGETSDREHELTSRKILAYPRGSQPEVHEAMQDVLPQRLLSRGYE
jgi:hypothetical protein